MRIHFIAIGGIGMSALARYYLSRGFEVTGSDLEDSEIIKSLRKQGVKISVGPHKKENLPIDPDLIVHNAAVTEENPELKEAKKRKINYQVYSQAVGELTKKYFTIAVSGTHGKSTTTAMIALILIEAGLDPTVIVGTKLREFGNSNFRAGKSKYLVIEADEYAASFLNYWPKIIVLTNIEEDHLDYYKNLKNIKKTFAQYLSHLTADGLLVCNGEDVNVHDLISKQPSNILQNVGGLLCDIKDYDSKLKIKGLGLKVSGKHNLMDAYAAITVARELGVSDEISVRALNNFQGTWRRFEYKGEVNGAKIFDDYGHHPTEIKATLQGAREYLNGDKRLARPDSQSLVDARRAISNRRLWCIFQPHQYQRTYQLFEDFVKAFDEADKLILLPIYSVAGREKENIKKKVSSQKLAEQIRIRNQELGIRQKTIFLGDFNRAARYLRDNLRKGDLAVIMGAGDVYKLTEKLIHK